MFPLSYKTSTLSLKYSGVLQGQLIFLIYVKRISDIVKFSVKYQIYADNIMIYTSYNNLSLVNKNDNPIIIYVRKCYSEMVDNYYTFVK